MAGMNSKWLGPKRGGGDYRRVRDDVKIDDPKFGDQPTERGWVERRTEPAGWRHGAKIYPVR